MTVTIRDVARAAGVSPSTVSRALSLPEKVDPATRARVQQLADHLGYRPNRAARGLITGRTGNLGLLLPDLANPFFPSLVKGVQQQAQAADYQVFTVDTDERPGAELGLVRSLAKQVDGMILCSPRMRAGELAEAAALAPTVLVNRKGPRLASVSFDNVDGVHQVLAHLAAAGHRDVGYVAGPRQSWSDAERTRGLRHWAGPCGVLLRELGRFAPTFEGGRQAVESVLLSGVSAVVAYNDLVALGLCRGLAERGVPVPGRLSVVGIDDIPLSGMVAPGLTTVAIPTVRAGRAAVDLLLALLADPPGTPTDRARQVDLPVQLVVRESTGAVAAEEALA